jgi:cyclopropane fatty-acyl-phospholipid synthase-like methyltransferase
MMKVNAKRAGIQIMKRLVHPRHVMHWLRCLGKQTGHDRAHDDAQLKLYAQILPGDFLHYGYFDNPSVLPETLSLSDLQHAQLRYAELILEQLVDHSTPVLDVGCGMGGLLGLLQARGFSPTALTPDQSQIRYIHRKYPMIPLIEGKFEEMPKACYKHVFGTVITAESVQYLEVTQAFLTMDWILMPGGRWIISDYFRMGEAFEKSGHNWNDFIQKLQEGGWHIVLQRDITSHVLPTLMYLHMWGNRLAFPLYTFLLDRFRRKRPALYYVFQEVLQQYANILSDRLQVINPEVFSREKKYMFLVIERG